MTRTIIFALAAAATLLPAAASASDHTYYGRYNTPTQTDVQVYGSTPNWTDSSEPQGMIGTAVSRNCVTRYRMNRPVEVCRTVSVDQWGNREVTVERTWSGRMRRN